MPYRVNAFDERRVRRLARKQQRVDKRILARAEERYRKSELTQQFIGLGLLMLLGAGFMWACWCMADL